VDWERPGKGRGLKMMKIYASFRGEGGAKLLSALLQNDSLIYISMHKRMKQGEKDETGATRGVLRKVQYPTQTLGTPSNTALKNISPTQPHNTLVAVQKALVNTSVKTRRSALASQIGPEHRHTGPGPLTYTKLAIRTCTSPGNTVSM
jgi:hypothetical protein